MVPDVLRGRVMSIYSMMFMGMAPFGALFAGLARRPHRRAAPTVARGGAICFVAAAIFSFHLPALRPEARQLILAQEDLAGRGDLSPKLRP